MSLSIGLSHIKIAEVRWLNPDRNQTAQSTREQMVRWINGGGEAWVADSLGAVQVGVVDYSPPYLRTFRDGRATDNLLSLPRY